MGDAYVFQMILEDKILIKVDIPFEINEIVHNLYSSYDNCKAILCYYRLYSWTLPGYKC